MSVALRATTGYLFRHPWQLVLAVCGIAIGVAVMVAVDLANQSSRKAFIASMNAVNGDATHQIVAGPGGVSESLYAALRVDAGIRSIAPIVSGNVTVAGQTMQLLGVDLFAEREFRSFSTQVATTVVGNGSETPALMNVIAGFLTGEDRVLMSERTADNIGVGTGGTFELLANGKTYVAHVSSSSASDDDRQLDSWLIADIATAQHWLDMPGKLSRIDVKIDSGDTDFERRIRDLLPSGVELLSAAGRTQTTADMSDAFMTNLFAMSLLALLVGIFLIYNSVAFTVLQRRDLIGILRALGLTRRDVLHLVLLEASVLGIVGSVLGLFAGTWLGKELLVLVSQAVSDHYYAVNVTDVTLDSFSIGKGFLAGLGATLVAAIAPALEAAAYRPRLALVRSVLESRAHDLLPKLASAGLALLIVAPVLLWLSGSALVAGLIALFLIIVGVAFCIPLYVRFVSSLLEPLAGKFAGIGGRLVVNSVAKSLSRTGVAVVALAVAVAATIGVSVMVESFRTSVSTWLNTTLQSDIYLGVPHGSLDPELITDLSGVAGVDEVSSSRRAWLESDDGRIRLIALQMASGSYAGTRLRDGEPRIVWQQFDEEEGILISDAMAYRSNLSPGDNVQLNTARGRNDFRVAAVFQSYDSNDGAILMSRTTYDRYFDDPAVDSLGIYLQPGADVDATMRRFREIAVGRQALIMNSNARIRDISLQIFDRTFLITNVLYWLAVGVAVIGIFGAMMALQLERAREFGVLRAIGFTPAQTGMLVSAQTSFIGFLSGLAAVPLGLVMAWVLIAVINRRAFGWEIDFTVSFPVLLSALLLAIGAAFVAGLYPAWRAANVHPALAMRNE